MRHLRTLTCVASAALVASLALAATPPKPRTPGQRAESKTSLQSLVTAEKAFAAMSVEKGTRPAFLAYLAPDGVMFRPLPINGVKSWEARPASKATLAWEPAYAEVAGSGDLGLTTGPWEFTPPPEAKSHDKAYGTFFSVWRKDAAGNWKLLADMGVSHDKPAQGGLGAVTFVAGPEHPAVEIAAAERLMSPMAMDMQLGRSLGSFGAAAAVRMWTANDVHFLQEGAAPWRGADGVARFQASVGHTRWIPEGGEMARSGDLGYSYGVREDSSAIAGVAPDSAAYLHVWRRLPGASWKLAAAVVNPVKQK